MREIKFRAWDESMYRMEYFGLGDTVPYYYPDEQSASIPYEVMQYTGLKDKNGKEIYEGDIVNIADIYDQVNFGGKRTYEKREVKYEDFGWLPFITPGGIDCSFMYSDTDCEVIGNIYENPELLK